MKSIAVFCASSTGHDPAFAESAKATGKLLVDHDITLIYGGGKVGLMGTIADTVMSLGGKVVGVIPEFLGTVEIAHQGLSELIVVKNMHERKMKMSELSEGVITLPGGFGTLEELTEMLTWSQLDLHHKPIGLLNVNGYYQFLEQLFDHMVKAGLLKKENRDLAIFDTDPEQLLKKMIRFEKPSVSKWLDKDRT